MRHVFGLALLLLLGSVQAAPVTYYVNATFDDHNVLNPGTGTVQGSFDFDSDTNALSNFNLVSSCGGECSYYMSNTFAQGAANTGVSYQTIGTETRYNIWENSIGPIGTELSVSRSISLRLEGGLPAAGGTASLPSQLYSYVGYWRDAPAYEGPQIYNFQLTGTISAVVPLPAAVWLFMSGLGLLGFARTRRI